MISKGLYHLLLKWEECRNKQLSMATDMGLCLFAKMYGRPEVSLELNSLLTKEFGDPNYPFNDDRMDYRMEQSTRSMHRNAKRIAWVSNKLAEYIAEYEAQGVVK